MEHYIDTEKFYKNMITWIIFHSYVGCNMCYQTTLIHYIEYRYRKIYKNIYKNIFTKKQKKNIYKEKYIPKKYIFIYKNKIDIQ